MDDGVDFEEVVSKVLALIEEQYVSKEKVEEEINKLKDELAQAQDAINNHP